VGLENINGSFGVSSTNDGSCTDVCAKLSGVAQVGVWVGSGEGKKRLYYTPQVTEAALTWSCEWHGEDDYPGAKPDGCEGP
jgi:hypothetical protein